MLRLLSLAVLTSLLGGCATADGVRSARLDALVGDLHHRGLFDGAVVVGTGGEIVWEKGFGHANAEAGVPFTPATPADGGSLAKTLTAALLLELEAEGTLSLDDPARTYLPELPYPELSLRHLITHASGLPDYDWFDAHVGKDVVRTTEVLLGALERARPPLAFPAGTAFEYSSLGFDFALLAAARAAGEPYGSLLSRRFLEPLGMTSAFLRPGRFADFPGVRTRGYRRNGASLEPNEVFDFEAFHGGSNLYLSVRDLHRWGTRPVSAEALEAARIGGHPSGLTLGSWYTSPDRSSHWYSGHLGGFHGELFRDTSRGVSVAYISNNTIAPWLQKGLVRAIRSILAGGDPGPLQPPDVSAIAAEERGVLAGTWGDLTIESRGNALMMIADGVAYRMVQIDPRFFYVPGLDFIVGYSAGRLYLSTNLSEEWIGRELKS